MEIEEYNALNETYNLNLNRIEVKRINRFDQLKFPIFALHLEEDIRLGSSFTLRNLIMPNGQMYLINGYMSNNNEGESSKSA